MRQELEAIVENYIRIPKKDLDQDHSFHAFVIAIEKVALKNKGSYAYTRKVHEIVSIYGAAVRAGSKTFLYLPEGKYRPLNAKKIHNSLKAEKSPIRFKRHTWHTSWMTSQGRLHYMVREGLVVAFTSHALDRFQERFHGEVLNPTINPVPGLFTCVVARMDAGGWATPTKTNEGIVLLTVLGAFLGCQEVLERPEAGFAAGTRIMLCKTYISKDMLRLQQIEEGTEEITQVLAEWESVAPRILELQRACDL